MRQWHLAASCLALLLLMQYGANSRDPSIAVQRALEFRSGKNTVVVSLNGSAAKGWALSATANSKPVVSSASLPNGVDVKVVRFDPPANGVKSRVIVDSGAGCRRTRCESCTCCTAHHTPPGRLMLSLLFSIPPHHVQALLAWSCRSAGTTRKAWKQTF